MARPQRNRRICGLPEHTRFEPETCGGGNVQMTLDEFEAIRLMDHEGLTHEQCAEVMQISRTTATEIYAGARRKLAEALVEGKPLTIGGGCVTLCDHSRACGYGVCGDTKKERELHA